MDTVHTAKAPSNSDGEHHVLTRKEIRRQKLMEYLTAKANLTLPSKTTNMSDVVESEKSAVKTVRDKENLIPTRNKDTTDKGFQSTYAVKKPLGQKHTVNISSSQLREKQKSKSTSSTNTEPKAPQIPAFTRTYTVVNPKSKPAAKTLSAKTRTITQATKAVNHTAKTCPSAASTSVNAPHTGRIIHGPIIKTRTGLTPAMLQPRNSKSCIIATGNDTKIAKNKAQSSSASHRPASQVSERSLRKTMPPVALKPVMERGAKANLKPAQSRKISERPRLSTRCSSVVSVKSDTKAKSTKTSATEGRFRSQPDINKSKSIQGKTSNPMATNRENIKQKNMASSYGDKSRVSKAPPLKPICAPTASKHRKMPLVSQTAPQPPRTVNFTKKPKDVKPQSGAPPPTVQKTLAAAEERIKKLQEWRASKGISYKRPPMFVKSQARRTIAVPQPFWSKMNEEDEAHSLITAVDRSLADCLKLLGEGCPTQHVKDVLKGLPVVSQKFAKYWICQARLMEREGDLDVLPMFEKAVGIVVEPVDELRTVVFEILKKRDENQEDCKDTEETAEATERSPETFNDPLKTPKPTRALICGEKGNSSVVKYKITATPGGPPSQRRESTVVNGQEVRFFTPVRRSVRIERASLRYPVSLQDHDLCVASYNDLMAEEEKETVEQAEGLSPTTDTPIYIYRENDALKDKVSVEYVCSDE